MCQIVFNLSFGGLALLLPGWLPPSPPLFSVSTLFKNLIVGLLIKVRIRGKSLPMRAVPRTVKGSQVPHYFCHLLMV